MLNPLRMRSALVLAGVVAAVVGVAASTVAGVAHAAQARAARRQLDNRAALVGAAAERQLDRYVDALELVAGGVAAAQPLTADAFTRITAPLRGLGLSGVPSIAFVVPASDDQIAATQALWRSRGSSELSLAPNRDVTHHLFAVLNRTIDGSAAPRVGTDSTRAPVAAEAMRQARASGRTTVSDPYQLLRDQVLPPLRRQLSVVLAAPVDGGRDLRFQGWVVISLRGQDFITATLQKFAQDLVDVTLWVRTADRRAVTVAALRDADTNRRDLHRTLDLTVAQARWTIQIDASAARLPGAHSALPMTTGIVGVLIALLAAVLLTGRARADHRVRAATSELLRSAAHLNTELSARYAAEALLRTTHDDLAAERTRLAQVLDALEVSVLTCDREGTITHLNRTARDHLAVVAGSSTIAEHSGCLRASTPDGRALAASELPLQRSLNGEIVDGLEITVVLPDGDRRILQVHSRPLHDPSGRTIGAVASSYDITALREHQAELTAFAGVVAHDLKAPLTAVTGFTHLAVSALTAGASPETPTAHLREVLRATQRMDRLIEELLRYAAARDAHLEWADIDLRALVDQVVADRLIEYAVQPGAPAPHVFVGPLPTIRADATMMRQLLDNLIGNSLKYVLPGQAARLDIAAETSGTGELRLVVADRGIGIPPGQHGAVFAGFFRAAPSGHYAGTGLGLSICQRIAQRHGGTITAADNPGGGTRITVTLPAATGRPPRTAAQQQR
ncbi:ATP-binding protein [Actinoplanes sp. NPDC026619]|uniref:ATP-binding protein n=1 Tax=Actinoplanes sp. NPDC026619 TaxID=3155798 RepID=UPI00340964E3